MKLTKICKIKLRNLRLNNLWINSFTSENYMNDRDKVINGLKKIPTIPVQSVRRPEHKNISPEDYYDAIKNPNLINYLNKVRNVTTRRDLYEHCIKLLIENGVNMNKVCIAFEIGCGSVQQSKDICEYLNQKYFENKILWYGIDVSKFMLQHNTNPIEKYTNDYEFIMYNFKDLDKLQSNFSFDLCISVAMLQWLTHSRLSSDEINQNLSILFEFLAKFLSLDSGVAIFHLYPDSSKNIFNILDFLSLPNISSKFEFTLYQAYPHNDKAIKWFLFLKKILNK